MENNYDLKKLKQALHEKRTAAGLTIKALAEKVGKNVRTISDIDDPENEKYPDLKTLIDLCHFYDCDIDALFGNLNYSKHDLKYICEYTGLSENAVNDLHNDQLAISERESAADSYKYSDPHGYGEFISELMQYGIIDILSRYCSHSCISKISVTSPYIQQLSQFDSEKQLFNTFTKKLNEKPNPALSDRIRVMATELSDGIINIYFYDDPDEQNRFFLNDNTELTTDLLKQTTINKLRQQLDKMIDELFVF